MAKGFKTGGRDFPPGYVRGPRKKDPPELHLLKQLNRTELKIILNKILLATREELENFKGSMIEECIAKAVKRARDTGNLHYVLILLEKLIPGGLQDDATDEFRSLLAMSRDEIMKEAAPMVLEWLKEQKAKGQLIE